MDLITKIGGACAGVGVLLLLTWGIEAGGTDLPVVNGEAMLFPGLVALVVGAGLVYLMKNMSEH